MRRSNPLKLAARAAGQPTYLDEASPCWCGCVTRYAANGQCRDCLIEKGKARYLAQPLEVRKARDHARYLARIAKGDL